MTASATLAQRSRLRGSPQRRRNEGAVRAVLFAAALLSILISIGIVLALVFEAISFLSHWLMLVPAKLKEEATAVRDKLKHKAREMQLICSCRQGVG